MIHEFIFFVYFYIQSTQHGIEQRNNLRNTGYGVDDVVVNRHRRTNQKRYPIFTHFSSENSIPFGSVHKN